MEFFNIGTGELVFLVLLAILLVGPKRAVELVQQGGRLMARLRREWMAVQRDVLSEVQALKEETLGAVEPSLREDLRRVAEETKALEKEVQAIGRPAGSQAPRGKGEAPLPQPVGPGEDMAG